MNRIEITGEIGWDTTAEMVKEQLDAMEGDVEVVINSPGGSVFDGVAIYNHLEAYDKGSINVVINGLAASMASYIALAGDTVKAYDNATYMIHNVSTIAWGDHRDLRKAADTAEGLTALLSKKYVEKTKYPKARIREMMDDETWMFGDEILSNGFADELISTEEDKDPQASVAMAKETFGACIKAMKEHQTESNDLQMVAKLLEEPKPQKKAAENKEEGEAVDASMVETIRMRLKTREKETK